MNSPRNEVLSSGPRSELDHFALPLETIKAMDTASSPVLPIEILVDQQMHPPPYIEKT